MTATSYGRTAADARDVLHNLIDDAVDRPNPVRVAPGEAVRRAARRRPLQRVTGLGIADIGQLPVTVDDVAAAPPQFFGHRGLAAAGNAFDQIVPDAHPKSSTMNLLE